MRDLLTSATLWAAFGFLAAWITLGCASCPYDAGCYEVGEDYTDSGVGCVVDCLAPMEDGR